jgi:regulator of nucleoside diphosphate kinase
VKPDFIILTIDDMDRLAGLVRTLRHSDFRDQQQLELLDEVLQNADVIASEHVPIDVIRMNSRIRVLDLDSGARLRYTLVFPENADISKRRISVLAPVGSALLGRRRGDVVEAKVPGGRRRLQIEHVRCRPSGRRGRIRPGPRITPQCDSPVAAQSARIAA